MPVVPAHRRSGFEREVAEAEPPAPPQGRSTGQAARRRSVAHGVRGRRDRLAVLPSSGLTAGCWVGAAWVAVAGVEAPLPHPMRRIHQLVGVVANARRGWIGARPRRTARRASVVAPEPAPSGSRGCAVARSASDPAVASRAGACRVGGIGQSVVNGPRSQPRHGQLGAPWDRPSRMRRGPARGRRRAGDVRAVDGGGADERFAVPAAAGSNGRVGWCGALRTFS